MTSDDRPTEPSEAGAAPPGTGGLPPGGVNAPASAAGDTTALAAWRRNVWGGRGPRHRGLVLAALIVTLGVAWITLRPESNSADVPVGRESVTSDACRPVLDALDNPVSGENPLPGAGFATDEVPLALTRAGIRTYQCLADAGGSSVLALHVDIGSTGSRGSLFLLSPAAPGDLAPAWLEGSGSPWSGSEPVASGAWRFYGPADDPLYRDLEEVISTGGSPPTVSLFRALTDRDPTGAHPRG